MDPWNGSYKASSSFSVTGITRSGLTATAASTAHPFKTGDRVVVSGVTGAYANLYNGSFTVTGFAANTFDYTMAASPGGNVTGSFSAQVDPFRFDSIMRSLASSGPVCVHIGPGEFRTLGYYDGLSGGWQIRPGMRIVGSGMDVTKLKLGNTTANAQNVVYAIGHDLSAGTLVDQAEVCELTVDCNLSGQTGAFVAAGAVRMMGNHARVTRVKAINWGSKYHATTPTPGFVFLMITGDLSVGVAGVANCGIDQCIAVQPVLPNPAPTVPVTVFRVGAREIPSGAAASGDGPYIRNCYVDVGQVSPFINDVRALSMSWCRAGVVEGNQVRNVKFGGPYETSTGAYEITVRNNTYRNVTQALLWKMSTAGISKLLVYGNTIELATGTNGLFGVQLDDNSAGSPPHGDVVIENNWIRYLDGSVGSSTWGAGIQVFGALTLSTRQNVLELAASILLSDRRCGSVGYFNNKSPNGKLIRGNLQTGTSPTFVYVPYNELATEAEEAFILGFLKRA
jgi:hypothetical protein